MNDELPDGVLGVQVEGGIEICVPADVRLLTPFVLLEQERWFEDEVRLVGRALGPGMHAVDVGANYGCYATAMARAVGPEGRVLCLEPAPDTAQMLRMTLVRNGLDWAEVRETAVSDGAGSVRFSIGTAAENNRIAGEADSGGRVVTVPRLPLDELVPRAGWPDVAVVKIDAEGHTREAIEGGAGLFRHGAPLVLFEILLESGELEEALGERFREWGYGLYRWVPGPGVLESLRPGQPLDAYQMNLVALKPERTAALAAQGLAIEADTVSTGVAQGAWTRHSERLAHVRHLARRWHSGPRWLDGRAARDHYRALDLYGFARATDTRPAQAVASLRAALDILSGLDPEAVDPLAHQCITARIAAALGLRSRSTAALRRLVELAQAGSAGFGALPFPAPAPRFDAVPIEGAEVEWMEAAIYEGALDQAAWSAYFVGADWLPLVERQMELPYATPLVRRRVQLIRMRYGLQAEPVDDPVLLEVPGATLNRGFWERRRGPRR